MNLKQRHSAGAGVLVLALALVFPLAAQSTADREKMHAQSQLVAAESLLASAKAAGAATLAPELYTEASDRLGLARASWNSDSQATRQRASLRAVESANAAAAAEAQARLLSANGEIRNLQADITNFGAVPMNVEFYVPVGTITRGITSTERVIVAENALRQARAAGGDRVAASDLKRAEDTLKTARMLAKNKKQDENADHLSYVAEMLSRRAESLARLDEVSPRLPDLRAERRRLAQRAADTRAQEEQARRLEAERQAAVLRQQLDAQSANRQAEQAEIQRLREQVATSELQFRTRLSEDRTARVAAEQNLDQLVTQYQTMLAERGASDAEVERLRRQVEDQSMSLRAIQERERLSQTSMGNQIQTLQQALERERSEGRGTSDALSQREAELRRQSDELQKLAGEREESERRRAEAETARSAAIADADRKRTEAEAQSEQLRQQIMEERSRAAETEAELANVKQELSRRDTASQQRIESMQQELSKLAATRTSDRGFIVTLPGLFFDTGKSALKTGARNTLTKIAEQLRINEDTRIAVEGHTDSVGTDDLNQTLSEKRAAAVRDYLVSRGVPTDRITTTGLGETSPVATNDTAAGRQQNRRVELVITQ
ncbi:MAG: OmpA family protein [Acidobacteriota bacterium]